MAMQTVQGSILLLILSPLPALFFLKLSLVSHVSQVQYTIGSPAALKVARQYYASGLHLSGGTSPRALLGITASTAALGAQKVPCPSWRLLADSQRTAKQAQKTAVHRYLFVSDPDTKLGHPQIPGSLSKR